MASTTLSQSGAMTARVLGALAADGIITGDQVATIEAQANREGRSPGRDVIARGFATEADVAAVLEEVLGVPRVDLQSYAPDEAALRLVPDALAHELGVLPLFEIEGVLTVAIGQARDVFVLDGMGARIGLEIEAVLADPEALRQALEHYYPGAGMATLERSAVVAVQPTEEERAKSTGPGSVPGAERVGAVDADALGDAAGGAVADALGDADPSLGRPIEAQECVAYETPAQAHQIGEEEASAGFDTEAASIIDLDVLAVADSARTMLLVTEIFERAVYLGATKIHVVPEGSDFVVAFRIGESLETVASAPLSLQPPLVDGVRMFMGLPKPALGQPSVGRMRSDVGGMDVTFSLSAVKTTSGWRMVVSIDQGDREPQPLSELGLTESDLQRVEDLVEKGSGLLIIAAPIGEGSSETYYSALSHVVSAGRSVLSIEQSIDRTVPGSSQIAVAPGSPVAAAAYLSAALAQDTDVLAVNPAETATDLRLAIEAAREGKLVVATFAAANAASAVQRMLRLGVDPTSLASALAGIVAQRAVETRHGTGTADRTFLFEVVHADASVKAAIADEVVPSEFERIVAAAGTTSLREVAASKLAAGTASAAGLDLIPPSAG